MDTQLAEAFTSAPDAGDADTGPVTRDYEAEAREMGWVPLEEFKGDPTRHADAQSFVEKGEVFMPLLKKQNDSLRRELKDVKKQIRKASDHFSKAEERAYNRALSEIQARQDEAASVGDVEGVKKAREEMAELASDLPEAPNKEALAIEAQEAEIDWRDKNPWFDKPGLARDFALTQAQKLKHLTATMAPADFFEMIGEKTRERFGEKLDRESPRKPANAVEAPGLARPRRGQKSFSDLPLQAQTMCDKWVKSGLIKSREDYVKSYQWDS